MIRLSSCDPVLDFGDPLVRRRIVEFNRLAQFFSRTNSHVATLLEVTQVTESVVVLRDSDKNSIGALWTDRVG